MKYLVYVCRVLVGSLFIVSGLIKVNDALGFYYKLQEYAEPGAFNMAFLDDYGLAVGMFVSIAEILLGIALLIGALPKLVTALSMVMMVFFTVLTGYTCNCDPQGTTTVMVENEAGVEVEETIANQCVLECGCFGNAIPLKACESYAKDWILDILLLPIFIWAWLGRIRLNTTKEDMYLFAASLAVMAWFCMTWLDWLFPVLFTAMNLILVTALKRRSTSKWKEWYMAAVVLVLSSGVQYYTMAHLPLRDYRPYAEGKNITIQMQEVDGLITQLADLLTDGDKTAVEAWLSDFEAVDPDIAIALRGKSRQILGLNEPAKSDSINVLHAAAARMGLKAPELATEYTFRNTKTGQDTMILSTEWLKIYGEDWFKNNYENVSYDGASVTLSEGVEPGIVDLAPENYEGELMLDAVLDAEWVFLHISKDLSTASTSTQPDLNALAKAAQANGVDFYGMTNASYDEAEGFRHEHQAAYPFLVADQIELKIIVRSNPGLVLLNRGTVVKKWAWRDVPAWDDVKGDLIP